MSSPLETQVTIWETVLPYIAVVMSMKKILHISILLLALYLSAAGQTNESLGWSVSVERELVDQIAENDLARKIYTEVVARLRQAGIPADFVRQTFSHPEIEMIEEVVHRFEHPAEEMPYVRYRTIFVTQERISKGTQFYHEKKDLIEAVVDSFGVDPLLIISIVGTESEFGANSEEFPVFNALHTIIHKIPRKEKWAEKEMTEYIEFCYVNFIPPMNLRGSYAGAFGYGQFIPSSFNRFAVDFDGDGIRNPFEWSDVFASIANYLVRHGYEIGSSDFSRNSANWRSILAYNYSSSYARAVLELRDELKKRINVGY